MLVFAADAGLWSVLNPAEAGAPVHLELGVAVGQEAADVRLAAVPSEETIWLFSSRGRLLHLDGGIPAGPPSLLTTASLVYYTRLISLSWSGGRPVGAFLSSEGNRDRHYAFDVGTGAFSPLPPPPPEAILDDRSQRAHEYGLSPTLLGLGADRALFFFNEGSPADGGIWGTGAAWLLLKRDPLAAPGAPAWFVPDGGGTLELPGASDRNRAWIQVHALGPQQAALTWAETSPGNQVYDVFLALLAISSDGTPILSSRTVNVSNTDGLTDNSDFPIVLSSGDGRIWVAWRESSFGPRVALYGPQLDRLGIAAPAVELHNDGQQLISAAADALGRLHLAAVVRPGGSAQPEVRYWILQRP